MKLISGKWFYGETVTIEVDGKTINRKVQYGSLNGLYILYKGEKIGIDELTEKEE